MTAETGGAPAGPRAVAEAYWRDECLRDVDLVLGHYHPDGEFQGPNGPRLVGHEQIRGFYEASVAAFPGLAVAIVAGVEDGDRGAFEFVAELTDHDGRVYPARGTNMVVVRDGKFVSNHSYFDTSELP
ncbi:MAG TPA: nuclear transport factor 2 family protein [Candidatus Limnocylindrales bacterium]|nr:nuclear transport factor 2 family protein [Candidatus Limnocylindrales bacterium]